MNSAVLRTKWHRFRNSFFWYARLCWILFGRGIFWTGHLLRELKIRLQYLWLTAKIWSLRFCRTFVKYPGWTIATVTGAIGIILLVMIQIAAFFPKSASDSEPLMEPFIEVADVKGAGKGDSDNSEKVEVLHNDSVKGHDSIIETNMQPVFDVDVVLFPFRDVQESPEQFLVTSVTERHPLNPFPIRTGKSLWNAFSLNHNRIAIQPTDYQPPELGKEPSSAEFFVEPYQTNSAHNGIENPGSDSLSSAFTTTIRTAETTTEPTKIATTPKLNLVVTIAESVQLGQPERIQFHIVNQGGISAMNVVLGIEIPGEFSYSKGQSLEFKVGEIPPGETRIARLTPKAVKTGVAVFEIEVTADEGFSQILKQHVEVVSEELWISGSLNRKR